MKYTSEELEKFCEILRNELTFPHLFSGERSRLVARLELFEAELKRKKEKET